MNHPLKIVYLRFSVVALEFNEERTCLRRYAHIGMLCPDDCKRG